MLTKSDLSGIKKIVQSEIQTETRQIIQKELTPIKEDLNSLKQDVGTLKQDVGTLKQDVGTLKEDMDSVKKNVKSLKKDMRYVKKTVRVMVPFFNNEDIQLQKRVRRIEDHLALST